MRGGEPPATRAWLGVGLALLAVYLVWGSTYLAIRIALEGFPPFLMAGGRFVVAGALLFVFTKWRGSPAPTPTQWGSSALVGALLLVGGNGGVVFAEQTVASGLTALAVATVALWTALFAGLWGQWPGRLEWVGLAVGFGGIILLNLEGSLRASPAGAAALLVATVSWAFGSVWSRRLTLPAGLMAPAAEMLAGGVLLIAIGWLAGESLPERPGARAVVAVAYLIVFGSLIGFSAYVFLLTRVRPTVATSYAYVNPVIAVGLGVAFAGETITPTEWLAMPVVLAGVVLVILARAQANRGGPRGLPIGGTSGSARPASLAAAGDEDATPGEEHAAGPR
ncbi:MAG: drug/metabolite exporter YedA [Acidobacteriota bacterium]